MPKRLKFVSCAIHAILLHLIILHILLPIGRSGSGIAWYLNFALIPVINVTRGNTYTFLIYGGNNSSNPSNYHPFYISNSIAGGRLANAPEEVRSCYCTPCTVAQMTWSDIQYNLFTNFLLVIGSL